MYLYTKIGKHKNIVYYIGQNNKNSKYSFILIDAHRVPKCEYIYEDICAWVDNKTGEILWDDKLEHIIDKNYIKSWLLRTK